jgi:hypothetical protein
MPAWTSAPETGNVGCDLREHAVEHGAVGALTPDIAQIEPRPPLAIASIT